MENDVLNLVKVVRKRSSGRTPLDLVMEDIVSLSDDFNVYLFSHVKRVGNSGYSSVC